MKTLSEEDFNRLKSSGMLYVVHPESDGTYEDYLKGQGEMAKFSNMKIRIKDPEHSKQVQEALFKMGYDWLCGRRYVQLVHMPFLFAEDDGAITYCTDERHFNTSKIQEYYTTELGNFDPVDTFELPKPSKPAPQMPSVKPPKPYVRSRKEVIVERMKELAEGVCSHLEQSGEGVPVEWLDELLCLNVELEDYSQQ